MQQMCYCAEPSHCRLVTALVAAGRPSFSRCIPGPPLFHPPLTPSSPPAQNPPRFHCLTSQELPAEWRWVSEAIFTSCCLSFILWTFSPLIATERRFPITLLWSRLLSVIVGGWRGTGLAAAGFAEKLRCRQQTIC